MSVDFTAQRVKMVDGQLRTTDVTGRALLQAFLDVPRELFVPQARRALAYLDADIEIAPGRYLGEASPIAKLMALAGIATSDKVLNIGAGAGYDAAILSKLAGSVVALESDLALAGAMAENLRAAGVENVTVETGELARGAQQHAPFDVIFFSGSAAGIPAALFDQLKAGGRLAVVEGGIGSRRQGSMSATARTFPAALASMPPLDPCRVSRLQRSLRFNFLLPARL